jgi:cutinase
VGSANLPKVVLLLRRNACSIAALIGAVTGTLVLGTAGKTDAATDSSCPMVEVVFARGTFEPAGVGATGQAFIDALTARLAGGTEDV